MDRRSLFFLIAALVCALLTLVTEPGLRFVPVVTSVVYVVLAVASYADDRSRG